MAKMPQNRLKSVKPFGSRHDGAPHLAGVGDAERVIGPSAPRGR